MSHGGRSDAREEDSLIAALARAPDRSLGAVSAGVEAGRPRGLEVGDRLGRFVVTGRLGAGGMGEVYAAQDDQLRRRVAVKVMHARKRKSASASLQQEAQAMARLQHPNVVTVYDVGWLEGGEEFVAMELVDGSSLRQWLASQERAPREILRVFLAAGRGLAAAHEAGIVHRDFKPDNVLVGKDGSVRVADFGLAVSLDPEDGGGAAQARPFAGTPRYMADEQRRGLPADARSDQFSFCVALYEALAGRHPFEVRDPAGNASDAGREEPEPPPRGAPLGFLWPAILRGLSKDPARRHPSMHALLADLERDPWQARRRWAGAVLALASVAALAIGARAWARHRSELCSGGERRLQGVWDARRKAAVEKAFAAASADKGAQAAQAVVSALDAYAPTLATGHAEACEAAQVRREQSAAVMDLRMRCLDRLAAELGALVSVLESADAKLLDKAAGSVAQLKPAAVCADVAALSAPDPRPQQPARRARITAVEQRYAQGLALYRTARYREGHALFEALLPEAQAVGWAPLLAEVWLLAARCREAVGDNAGAEAAFIESLIQAATGRHEDVAAQVWTLLAINLGRVQGRLKEARMVARLAHAAVRRLGNPFREEVLQQAEGLLAYADGHYLEAREHYQRALALEEQRMGPDSQMAAELMNSLGNTQDSLGDVAAARALYLRSSELFEKTAGPDSFFVGVALSNLGALELTHGDPADAERHLRRALALAIKQFGPDHPRVVPRLDRLARALARQGKFDEALQAADRAAAVSVAANGPEHSSTLGARLTRAEVLSTTGRQREAQALLVEVLAAQERTLGPTHPRLAETLTALGQVELAQRARAQAARHFSRALALLEAAKIQGSRRADAVQGLAAAQAPGKRSSGLQPRAAQPQ